MSRIRYCCPNLALRATFCVFFFFNDTATTEIYTLSLHDALPIYPAGGLYTLPARSSRKKTRRSSQRYCGAAAISDRKSTRLNSSHGYISYAVFCLKKKKKNGHYFLRVLAGRVQTRKNSTTYVRVA